MEEDQPAMTPAEHDDAFNVGLEAAARLCETKAMEENEAGERIEAEDGVCELSDRAWFRRSAFDEAAADIRSLKVRPATSGDAFRKQRDEDALVINWEGAPSGTWTLPAGMSPLLTFEGAPPASGEGAPGDVSANPASEWQDGPEPVYAPLSASERRAARQEAMRRCGYWNPTILDRLYGWLR